MGTFQSVLDWMQIQDANGEYIGTPDTPENRAALAETLRQWLEDIGDGGAFRNGIVKALETMETEENKMKQISIDNGLTYCTAIAPDNLIIG